MNIEISVGENRLIDKGHYNIKNGQFSNCCFLRNLKRKSDTERIFNPCGVTAYEITTWISAYEITIFENIDFGVT